MKRRIFTFLLAAAARLLQPGDRASRPYRGSYRECLL